MKDQVGGANGDGVLIPEIGGQGKGDRISSGEQADTTKPEDGAGKSGFLVCG